MSENRLKDLFNEAEQAFNGNFGKELDVLTGLSKNEIGKVTPGTSDLKTYAVLIKVVEQASRNNLTQAELIEDIKELGDIAIKIAKKVPQFSALL